MKVTKGVFKVVKKVGDANIQKVGTQKVDTKAVKRVMLGVTIPPKEYQKADHKKMIENLLGKKTIKFNSQQFNNLQVDYDIVHVAIMPEATTAIIDEAISKDLVINKSKATDSIINIVCDIGGGTMDIVAMQGIKLIRGSEKTYDIGVNDALTAISAEIESKYNLSSGYITKGQVNRAIRFPTSYCPKCNSTVGDGNICAKCKTPFVSKTNMFKFGSKAVDISEIILDTFESITKKAQTAIADYINTLFKSNRSYILTDVATFMLVGGGSEMFGDMLIQKIKPYFGEFTEITRPKNAIWKTLSGLSKHILYENKDKEKDYDICVFVDMGNTSAKAKITDSTGKALRSPIEMLTQISTPSAKSSISYEEASKEDDLDIEIISAKASEGSPVLGDGHYFVSVLASEGKDITYRNTSINKMDDDITYTMINAAIGTLMSVK